MKLRDLLSGVRCVAVLAIGFPIVTVMLAWYGIRRAIFRIPVNGKWGEFGQCEVFIKGPNTWNSKP